MSNSLNEMRLEFENDFLGVRAHEKAYDDAMEVVGMKPSGIENKQIGGKHYLNKIQPWDIIDSWGLNFYEGNILKYLLRSKENRIEDLEKLIHYAEKLIELETTGKRQ